jgi:hypothetical protein
MREEHLCRKSLRMRYESLAIRYSPCLASIIGIPPHQFLRHFSLLSLPVTWIMLIAASPITGG